MMYKVPMPTGANGVKLYTLPNHQIGIEYQTGDAPHLGKMAYDSTCGATRNISFRRSRPDIEKIVADAVRQVDREDAMPRAGLQRNMDMKTDSNLEYDDDASEVIGKLLDYLEKYLDQDQMEAVNMILSSGDAPDADQIGEKSEPVGDRRTRRQASDSATRRPMTTATERKYSEMFPHWNRLS
jgi:hypothetical protein